MLFISHFKSCSKLTLSFILNLKFNCYVLFIWWYVVHVLYDVEFLFLFAVIWDGGDECSLTNSLSALLRFFCFSCSWQVERFKVNIIYCSDFCIWTKKQFLVLYWMIWIHMQTIFFYYEISFHYKHSHAHSFQSFLCKKGVLASHLQQIFMPHLAGLAGMCCWNCTCPWKLPTVHPHRNLFNGESIWVKRLQTIQISLKACFAMGYLPVLDCRC